MPPKKGTRRWIPVPIPWEGVRVSEDGRHLFVVYILGTPGTVADRADVRWDQKRLTLTLSRMADGDGGNLAAVYHCVEVPLSQDASDRILIDGATGERGGAKRSRYLDPEVLRGSERSLDAVFDPRERLDPRETTA
jgi:hypothetical protein